MKYRHVRRPPLRSNLTAGMEATRRGRACTAMLDTQNNSMLTGQQIATQWINAKKTHDFMARRWTEDKTFPQPMLTQFTDAYMRHIIHKYYAEFLFGIVNMRHGSLYFFITIDQNAHFSSRHMMLFNTARLLLFNKIRVDNLREIIFLSRATLAKIY